MSDEYTIANNFRQDKLNETGYWREMRRLEEAAGESSDGLQDLRDRLRVQSEADS